MHCQNQLLAFRLCGARDSVYPALKTETGTDWSSVNNCWATSECMMSEWTSMCMKEPTVPITHHSVFMGLGTIQFLASLGNLCWPYLIAWEDFPWHTQTQLSVQILSNSSLVCPTPEAGRLGLFHIFKQHDMNITKSHSEPPAGNHYFPRASWIRDIDSIQFRLSDLIGNFAG